MCHKLVAVVTVRHQSLKTFGLESFSSYTMQKFHPIERRKILRRLHSGATMEGRVTRGGQRITLAALHEDLFELCAAQSSIDQVVQSPELARIGKFIRIKFREGDIYSQKN